MAFRATSGTTIAETTFANIPSPVGSNGLIIRVSDVGPAPGILLISNGTIWRPLNGSAVLYKRNTNPITVQSLAEQTAETIGPFPGGLVRAGSMIQVDNKLNVGAIGTAARHVLVYVGAQGASAQQVSTTTSAPITANQVDISYRKLTSLDCLADGSAAHRGGTAGSAGYQYLGGLKAPVVDFSQPWELRVALQSCAETAVNITAATWAAGVATYTATAHTLATGDKTTVAGITPNGYNVVGVVTVLNANTFTIPVAGDPGAYVSGGTSSRISNVILDATTVTLIG